MKTLIFKISLMLGFGLLLWSLLVQTAFAKAGKTQFEFVPLSSNAEYIAVFVGKDGVLSGVVADVNVKTGGRLETALKDAEFEGKFGKKLQIGRAHV